MEEVVVALSPVIVYCHGSPLASTVHLQQSTVFVFYIDEYFDMNGIYCVVRTVLYDVCWFALLMSVLTVCVAYELVLSYNIYLFRHRHERYTTTRDLYPIYSKYKQN